VRTSHDKGGIFLTEDTYDQQEIFRSMLAAQLEAEEQEGADA
jgi:hypothetical protein